MNLTDWNKSPPKVGDRVERFRSQYGNFSNITKGEIVRIVPPTPTAEGTVTVLQDSEVHKVGGTYGMGSMKMGGDRAIISYDPFIRDYRRIKSEPKKRQQEGISMQNKDKSSMILEGLNVDNIIKKSLKSSLPNVIPEAYAAEPKQFSQVSEMVSQKAKEAHLVLYKDYVTKLNRVASELDTVNRSEVNSNHSDYRSLKLDETYNMNATWLHELYFANCFDPNSEVFMDSLTYIRLQRDFGTFEDWQKDFMACAMSAGEGWAVCGYHMFLRRYVNTTISHHSGDVPLGLYPIAVIDMWSHAYYRDYLTDKTSYLVAQMREFNWEVVEERVNKAESIAEVLK